MVVDNKATITYVQLLKEDLVIIRLIPKDGPVPEYQAGQFITLGLPNPVEGGKIVSLVSDAGTPLISDPGYKLVSQARARNIRVVPVPGPSALITALSVAGLPTDRFIFEGFLPAKAEGRRKQLAGLALEPRTLVFYESPHRVQDSLKAMVEVFGSERKAVLARELTKRFETLIADSLGNLLERVAADQNQQRGEIVLAVEGLSREQQQADELPELEKMLLVLLEELSVKQSVALAVRLTGVNKNTVYEMALRLNKAGP